MGNGGESKSSFYHPKGFESFHSDLSRARWPNLVWVWGVCRRFSQWWLVFVLLGVDDILSDGGGVG